MAWLLPLGAPYGRVQRFDAGGQSADGLASRGNCSCPWLSHRSAAGLVAVVEKLAGHGLHVALIWFGLAAATMSSRFCWRPCVTHMAHDPEPALPRPGSSLNRRLPDRADDCFAWAACMALKARAMEPTSSCESRGRARSVRAFLYLSHERFAQRNDVAGDNEIQPLGHDQQHQAISRVKR